MQLLLDVGYESTTMEAIAAHAGVAKKTAYRFGANRDELIGMAVREWTDLYAPALFVQPDSAQDVSRVLRDILESICAHVLSDSAVRMFRLLTTEFPGKESLLVQYQRNGVERGRKMLSEWFATQHERRLIHVPDAAVLAKLLLSMAVAEPLRQIALGVQPPLPAGSIKAHLDGCVALILPLIQQQ
ncbi:TetR/AcrR family transcriptional regulator [Burkholderia sp. JP2-270]|uniref:TetR/AcrR family transcriptional regulator n=1 Tax=Burkholderia sp. JP2-270 TaxID=2217913 RepID=UPI0019551786|nr:TetR/AcrR family transcriptional regulator [Burkholderia sp. JP2-270]